MEFRLPVAFSYALTYDPISRIKSSECSIARSIGKQQEILMFAIWAEVSAHFSVRLVAINKNSTFNEGINDYPSH